MKTVIILRATSNSGKTTFAEYLASLTPDACICCADDYFTKNGLGFHFSLLEDAHSFCRDEFDFAIEQKKSPIIVANTNDRESEFSYYREWAEANDYRVFYLVLEKRHDNVNNHNVPQKTIDKQAARIRNSLKL